MLVSYSRTGMVGNVSDGAMARECPNKLESLLSLTVTRCIVTTSLLAQISKLSLVLAHNYANPRSLHSHLLKSSDPHPKNSSTLLSLGASILFL
jgi:hypothetical protein